MVSITEAKECKDHYALLVKANHEEWKQLKGCMHNIHLLPEEHAMVKATLLEKGRNGCSKYFLIPKHLRENIRIPKQAPCLKIENQGKIILAYIMEKVLQNKKNDSA